MTVTIDHFDDFLSLRPALISKGITEVRSSVAPNECDGKNICVNLSMKRWCVNESCHIAISAIAFRYGLGARQQLLDIVEMHGPVIPDVVLPILLDSLDDLKKRLGGA